MQNQHPMRPGVYPGLPFDEYLAAGCFGGSDAAYLATHSPANWREHRKQPPTKAMKFGTAAHCIILEGNDVFMNRYSKSISTPEFHNLQGMLNSIEKNELANDILYNSGNMFELSLFWDCPVSDVQCCARLDFMNPLVVGDLKTTSDASPKAFLQSVLKYGYHIQAGHYLDGMESLRFGTEDPLRFIFIAVEKKPPYSVGIFELDDEFLREGRRLAYIARHKFREAEEYGYWCAQEGIVKLTKSGVVESNHVIEL